MWGIRTRRLYMRGLLSVVAAALIASLPLSSCGRAAKQMTPEQIAFEKKQQENSLLAKTVRNPGSTKPYAKGTVGGTWMGSINDDPKTFNTLTARDADTRTIIDPLYDYLLDYDPYAKKWKPNLASCQIKIDEKKGTMDVIFTLRDDLYWTTLADPQKKVKVTSDDVVYWYNQIDGDKALQLPAYSGQFMDMPDGSKKHIDIQKIDERTFEFKYPRIIAMPELYSNMTFGPKYIFEPVKEKEGVEGLLKLWSINTDPKTIPSIGPYYIESYRPGISVTLVRNPNYWKTDDYGQHLPYRKTLEMKIIPNTETERLKFLADDIDSFSLRPQDLAAMVNKEPRDYTVYYGGATLGSRFIAWNENPKNLAPKYVRWFSNTKFRQAMSCFFDRDRIVKEVFRGLGQPQIHFFPKPNPYYDPNITEQYLYNPARGKKLLAEIGIKPNKEGLMQDSEGNIIEYTLEVPVEDNIPIDIANIYADDLKKVGIKLDVKPVNFQKMVDSIVNTYDWQAVMVGLGVSYFPTQGSNVWQSSGNFHIWRPLQEKPATKWEARIDTLYQEGLVERDPVKAKKIWDEYQHIILDQLPVMYTIRQDAFAAYRNKWGNIRFDTINAPDPNYIYLKP